MNSSDPNPVICVVTLDIGDGSSADIDIRLHDDPSSIATAFISSRGLPAEVKDALVDHLSQNYTVAKARHESLMEKKRRKQRANMSDASAFSVSTTRDHGALTTARTATRRTSNSSALTSASVSMPLALTPAAVATAMDAELVRADAPSSPAAPLNSPASVVCPSVASSAAPIRSTTASAVAEPPSRRLTGTEDELEAQYAALAAQNAPLKRTNSSASVQPPRVPPAAHRKLSSCSLSAASLVQPATAPPSAQAAAEPASRRTSMSSVVSTATDGTSLTSFSERMAKQVQPMAQHQVLAAQPPVAHGIVQAEAQQISQTEVQGSRPPSPRRASTGSAGSKPPTFAKLPRVASLAYKPAKATEGPAQPPKPPARPETFARLYKDSQARQARAQSLAAKVAEDDQAAVDAEKRRLSGANLPGSKARAHSAGPAASETPVDPVASAQRLYQDAERVQAKKKAQAEAVQAERQAVQEWACPTCGTANVYKHALCQNPSKAGKAKTDAGVQVCGTARPEHGKPIISSYARGLQRGVTATSEVYIDHQVAQYREAMAQRQEEARKRQEEQLKKEAPFKPSLNPTSLQLAEAARQRRVGQAGHGQADQAVPVHLSLYSEGMKHLKEQAAVASKPPPGCTFVPDISASQKSSVLVLGAGAAATGIPQTIPEVNVDLFERLYSEGAEARARLEAAVRYQEYAVKCAAAGKAGRPVALPVAEASRLYEQARIKAQQRQALLQSKLDELDAAARGRHTTSKSEELLHAMRRRALAGVFRALVAAQQAGEAGMDGTTVEAGQSSSAMQESAFPGGFNTWAHAGPAHAGPAHADLPSTVASSVGSQQTSQQAAMAPVRRLGPKDLAQLVAAVDAYADDVGATSAAADAGSVASGRGVADEATPHNTPNATDVLGPSGFAGLDETAGGALLDIHAARRAVSKLDPLLAEFVGMAFDRLQALADAACAQDAEEGGMGPAAAGPAPCSVTFESFCDVLGRLLEEAGGGPHLYVQARRARRAAVREAEAARTAEAKVTEQLTFVPSLDPKSVQIVEQMRMRDEAAAVAKAQRSRSASLDSNGTGPRAAPSHDADQPLYQQARQLQYDERKRSIELDALRSQLASHPFAPAIGPGARHAHAMADPHVRAVMAARQETADLSARAKAIMRQQSAELAARAAGQGHPMAMLTDIGAVAASSRPASAAGSVAGLMSARPSPVPSPAPSAASLLEAIDPLALPPAPLQQPLRTLPSFSSSVGAGSVSTAALMMHETARTGVSAETAGIARLGYGMVHGGVLPRWEEIADDGDNSSIESPVGSAIRGPNASPAIAGNENNEPSASAGHHSIGTHRKRGNLSGSSSALFSPSRFIPTTLEQYGYTPAPTAGQGRTVARMEQEGQEDHTVEQPELAPVRSAFMLVGSSAHAGVTPGQGADSASVHGETPIQGALALMGLQLPSEDTACSYTTNGDAYGYGIYADLDSGSVRAEDRSMDQHLEDGQGQQHAEEHEQAGARSGVSVATSGQPRALVDITEATNGSKDGLTTGFTCTARPSCGGLEEAQRESGAPVVGTALVVADDIAEAADTLSSLMSQLGIDALEARISRLMETAKGVTTS